MPRHDRGLAFVAPLEDIDGCVEWLRVTAIALPQFARFLLPDSADRWPNPAPRAMTFVIDRGRLRPGSRATAQRFDYTKAALDLNAQTLVAVDFLPMANSEGMTDAAPWGVRLERTFEDDQLRGEMSCTSCYFDNPDFGEAADLIGQLAPSAQVGTF
jgi:hypothetical protein